MKSKLEIRISKLERNSNDQQARELMAVKKEGEKYRCRICGNEVVVLKVGGGALVCCGKNMDLVQD